jgi:predicted alpha/beta-fold hydrolase
MSRIDTIAIAPPPFRAPWWLRSAHAQTIGGKVFRPDPGIALRRERVELPDGDFLDLDFAEPGEAAPGTRAALDTPDTPDTSGAPAVLVLHGLEGSARRRYMLLTYRALLNRGLRPIGLNFRSCGGEPNRLPRFYHSGETGDLRFALGHLAGRIDGGGQGAIGFALGGNALLKYLVEEGAGARTGLRAAVAISVPFDLALGAATLERGPMARVYTGYFLRSLRAKLSAKAELLRPLVDIQAGLRARTLRHFDDAVTAPLHGFRDAADYYHRSSSMHFLEDIRIPTLLLQAEDDPFLPAHALPHAAVAENPHLIPAFSRRGGHVGFIGGTPRAPHHHAEESAARFLADALLTPDP